jgi:dTDP-4-dehydrorhamnose 3,5-epimerase
MNFKELTLSGVYLIDLNPFKDNRGQFTRLFCKEELKKNGVFNEITQINFSHTNKKFSIRGLHFQYPPYAETKIIHCIKGKVLDVVVDIRHNSPTFLEHLCIELSDDKAQAILIPEGFAHGFQTLEDDSELIYFHTQNYNPEFEGGLHYNDPLLNIKWKEKPSDISEKDKNREKIDINYTGI